jgi:hypothetical protein
VGSTVTIGAAVPVKIVDDDPAPENVMDLLIVTVLEIWHVPDPIKTTPPAFTSAIASAIAVLSDVPLHVTVQRSGSEQS